MNGSGPMWFLFTMLGILLVLPFIVGLPVKWLQNRPRRKRRLPR